MRISRPTHSFKRSLAVAAAVAISAPLVAVSPANAAVTCNGLDATIFPDENGVYDAQFVNAAGEVIGTAGDDVIFGTNGPDVIRSGDGNDTICTAAGDDQVWAGAGDDWVNGGAGADGIRGEDDADIIFGGDG